MYRNEEGDETAEEERAWLASAPSATAAAATRGKLWEGIQGANSRGQIPN